MAGGWIDQPFVSSLNPEPPGSMVVVSLQPTVRFMDRCGMATGTRVAAQALWGDALPADRPPASLVRELYAAENADRDEPSGSQDMCGLVYPGISRLDYDASVDGGWFPAHVESTTRPRGRRLAGAGHPPRPGRAAAARLRSAGRQAAGSRRGSRASAPADAPATTRSWPWTSPPWASPSTSAPGPGTPSCPRSSSIPTITIDLRGLLRRVRGRLSRRDVLRVRRRLPGRRVGGRTARLLRVSVRTS